MATKAAPPVCVPAEHRAELEKLSKAALMDMVWQMARQLVPPPDDGGEVPDCDVIGTVRHEIAEIKNERQRWL